MILAPRADDDRIRIYRHGAEIWGEDRADACYENLLRELESLARFPEIGRLRDDVRPGLRSITVGEHVVYYRIKPDGDVRVSRILHARQGADSASEI